MASPYSPPVSDLLEVGYPALDLDYAEHFGLAPEHVPELIRMACDPVLNDAPSEGQEVWGPVHAWRALGELHAADAVEPLVALLEGIVDDEFSGDLARSIARIGTPALPHLLSLARGTGRNADARALAARALADVAPDEPETRAEVIAALTRLVEDEPNSDVVAEAVNGLLDLKAVEAAPAIERALADGRLEVDACGDWEDVRVELGLLEERLTPPPPSLLDRLIEKDYADDPAGAARMRKIFDDPVLLAELLATKILPTGPGQLAAVPYAPPHDLREPGPPAKRSGASAGAKRKMARQSRKKNRKPR